MTSQMTKDINCVYLDAVINNPNPNPIQAIYTEEKVQDILAKASDYQMSVVRFSIPGSSIPIRVMETLGVDQNTLAYSVTMERVVNDVAVDTARTYLQWRPEATNISPPLDYVDSTGINSYQYYSLFNYQDFIYMVNDALYTTFNNLTTKPPNCTAEPYIVFDPKTKLFSLVAQQAYIADPNNYINIYMNSKLFFFFNSFNHILKSYNDISGKDYLLIVNKTYEVFPNTNQITIPTGSPGAGTPGFVMVQDYNVLFNWNSLKSIVFTSGTIPSRVEYQPAIDPVTGLVLETGSQNFKNIITDMVPITMDGTENRSTLVYVPSAEYRMIDLVSDAPLRKLQLSLYWTDNHLRYFPVYLIPNDLISIKILFRRKGRN